VTACPIDDVRVEELANLAGISCASAASATREPPRQRTAADLAARAAAESLVESASQ
jgi:hypothetical protein